MLCVEISSYDYIIPTVINVIKQRGVDSGGWWNVNCLIESCESFKRVVMFSLSVCIVEHVSMISLFDFNIITSKDSNSSSSLPSWSILALNGIKRDIKLKITFQASSIKSVDVNIILFQKERYFHLLISAAANIYVSQLNEAIIQTVEVFTSCYSI